MSMTKQSAKTAVPRLRFPEFRDGDSWEAVKLENVLKFQVGFPFPSKGFDEEGGGIRLIRNRDLRSNDKPIYYVAPYSAEFVVSDGDILVGMDGDFSPCVWDGGDALLNQRVGRVVPKADNDKRFLLYFLTAQLKVIEQSAARTTVKHLSHSDVEKICEPLPVPVEQKKIADCLTSLDEVIAAQGRKVEALKAHKRGLMQQLFPREGETRPRLRFPEFRDAQSWDFSLLQELEDRDWIELGRGNVISHDEMRANPGLNPVYSSSVVNQGLMGTYAQHMFDEELISWSIDGGGHFFHRHKHKFSVTNVSGFMRVLSGAIVCRFLAYQLQKLHASHTFDYQQKAHPSVIRALYRVGLPSHGEQQRIADCLSSLDTQITAETHQLAALKTHKQGLMQQLFPAPEVV